MDDPLPIKLPMSINEYQSYLVSELKFYHRARYGELQVLTPHATETEWAPLGLGRINLIEDYTT